MKKYFFGLLAVVLAVGAVAFTTPANLSSGKRTNVFFKLNALPTQPNVITPSKYIEVSSVTGCTLNDQKACIIEVDPSQTSGTAPHRTLLSTTVIDEAQFDASDWYVTAGDDVITADNTLK
jgi:hypothetical protein